MAKKSAPRFIKLPVDVIEFPDYNPREISKKDFNKLRKDIRNDPNFLIQRPPLINHITEENRYVCYAGTQRSKAAIEENYKEIDVWVEDNVPRKLQDERMLKDNLHRGEWDLDKLSSFDASFLLDVGFSSDSLNGMFDDILTINEDEFNEDKAIEEIQYRGVITKAGDIYQLGSHRLMCGDSTSSEDVKQLFGEIRAKVVYSDPPYNIGYDYTKGHSTEKKRYTDTKLNDSKSFVDYKNFLTSVIANANLFTEPDAHFFFWCDETYIGLLQELYRAAGITNRRVCLWIKNNFTPVPQMAFNKVIEPCVYGTTGKPFLNKELKNFTEVINQDVGGSNIYDDLMSYVQMWLVRKENPNNYVHPTQKPLGLHEKPLKRCSAPGDVVADFFGGSGSTLISCEQLKRTAFLMEKDPIFCDVIIMRWEQLTGAKAELIKKQEYANATD